MVTKKTALISSAAFIAVIVVVAGAVVFGPTMLHSMSKRSFDSNEWKSSDQRVRGQMVEDLEAGKTLDGLWRREVVKLLGSPDLDEGSHISYDIDLGHRFGSTPWLYRFKIEFSGENRVTHYYHHD